MITKGVGMIETKGDVLEAQSLIKDIIIDMIQGNADPIVVKHSLEEIKLFIAVLSGNHHAYKDVEK